MDIVQYYVYHSVEAVRARHSVHVPYPNCYSGKTMSDPTFWQHLRYILKGDVGVCFWQFAVAYGFYYDYYDGHNYAWNFGIVNFYVSY